MNVNKRKCLTAASGCLVVMGLFIIPFTRDLIHSSFYLNVLCAFIFIILLTTAGFYQAAYDYDREKIRIEERNKKIAAKKEEYSKMTDEELELHTHYHLPVDEDVILALKEIRNRLYNN